MSQTENKISPELSDNMIRLRAMCQNTSDFTERQIQVAGIRTAVLTCEGMVDQLQLGECILRPLMEAHPTPETGEALFRWLEKEALLAIEQKECYTLNELFVFLMSGFAVILAQGCEKGIALGVQGYNFRSISEPTTEMNLRGAREGFVEPLRVNETMIRRRIKSPTLKFDCISLGSRSQTETCLIYLTDRVQPHMVEQVRRQIGQVKSDIILGAGYLQPYMEGRPLSIFSRVGVTERPDVLCSKINEGRIAILVDGTPFALIVPYLFNEHFQTLDDYAYRPYYAALMRILKYAAFFISILLPGMYVAVSVFNPELLPDTLLFNIAEAEEKTPFPMMMEALIIHLIYEIMREAGLRLPRPIGHAVSIVGAMVIGDAAVKAGLIGSPMVMIVALTAVSSFVVPSLYEAVSVLKFIFIIIGGTWGLYGIALGLMILAVNLCALRTEEVPLMAPISPFSRFSMRDTWLRTGWKKLGKKSMRIQNMPGSFWKRGM